MSLFIIFTNLCVKVCIVGEAIILETSKTEEDKVMKKVRISMELKKTSLFFFLFSLFCFVLFSPSIC